MKEKILLSGYTKRLSKGIYSVTLDTETEELSDLAELISVSGPTYLALDKKNHLYSVAAGKEANGGLSSFSFNGQDISFLNSVFEEGAPHCHLSVDEEKNLVYAANYHKGEVHTYHRLTDGSLELSDFVKHEDHHGPKPEQNAPHCHYAGLTPDQKLVVCDLGNDELYIYDVSDEGKLSQSFVYKSAEGAGPRHIVFSSDGHTAFLACELDSTVEVLSYENGQFSLLQKISTLPAEHQTFNGVAAIRLSSDNNFLYVSNRGHNSITIYKVEGQSLELLSIIKTEGEIPRDFNLIGDENFLLVAHQESDNLTLFKRDKLTGQLKIKQKDFFCPEATCVVPLI
ncbi:MAG: lactonase family protein [Lactovum sp.]